MGLGLERWNREGLSTGKKINGSEIVGGGNSRSGVACGSAIIHVCYSPFKNADHDLPRRFLWTSVIRVQFRSDRGWQLIKSDLRVISSRSTWVLILSLTFFLAAFASGLVTGHGVRANFAARVSQGGSYSAAYAWRMRCEIYLTTSSLATVLDSLDATVGCYRSANCGCGTYAHIPSLKKGNQSALLAHVCVLATLAMVPTLSLICHVTSICYA